MKKFLIATSEWLLLGVAAAIVAAMFQEFLRPENQNEVRNLALIALGVVGILLIAIHASWEQSPLRKGLILLMFAGIVWQGTQFIGLVPQGAWDKAVIAEKTRGLWRYVQEYRSVKPETSIDPEMTPGAHFRGLKVGESARFQFELRAKKPSDWFKLEEHVGKEIHRRSWHVYALDCQLRSCVIIIKQLRDGTMVRTAFRDTGGKQLWGGDYDVTTTKISFVATEPTRLVVTLTRKS